MLFFLMTWNLTKVRPLGPMSIHVHPWRVNHGYTISPTRTMYQVIHEYMLYTDKIVLMGGFFSWFDLICGQVEANTKCFYGVWAKRISLLNVLMYHFILVFFFFFFSLLANCYELCCVMNVCSSLTQCDNLL